MDKSDYAFIQTERLELRELTPSGYSLVYALRSRPEVVKYTYADPYTSVEEAVSYVDLITASLRDRCYCWTISLREGVGIGTICLWNISTDRSSCELGYDLLPEYWGLGYIPEAAKAVLNLAFSELNFSKVFSHLNAENIRSVAVLRKCGFIYDGDVEIQSGEPKSTMSRYVLDEPHR